MIIVITSGIRGGVGKSVIATILAYVLNFLGRYALVVDVGGGSTRYVVDAASPPFTRELGTREDKLSIILRRKFTYRIEEGRLFKRKVEEREVEVYLMPEIRELDAQEVEGVAAALPEVAQYFDFTIVDMPAVSGAHYWRLLDVADLEVLCLVPERAFYEQILATARTKEPLIVLLNKFDEKIPGHKEVERGLVKNYGEDKVLTVPYDPVLEQLGDYGLPILSYVSPSKETAMAFSKLVAKLEDVREELEEAVV